MWKVSSHMSIMINLAYRISPSAYLVSQQATGMVCPAAEKSEKIRNSNILIHTTPSSYKISNISFLFPERNNKTNILSHTTSKFISLPPSSRTTKEAK